MKMSIELADNGIILRNPDCEDDVTLALEKPEISERHGDEYRAIGWRVYDCLMNVLLLEQSQNEIITTGFDITVIARCTGHGRME